MYIILSIILFFGVVLGTSLNVFVIDDQVWDTIVQIITILCSSGLALTVNKSINLKQKTNNKVKNNSGDNNITTYQGQNITVCNSDNEKVIKLLENINDKFPIVEKENQASIVLDVVEKIMTEFTDFHRDFLSHRSKKCISYKDYLKYFGYPDADSLPDGDFLCHGDFHFANLMRNGSGESEDSGKLYAIDFMNLCHGPKEYDIARAYVLIVEDSLPKDMPEPQRKMLLEAKAAAGKMYLEKMGFSLEQLKPFIPAVEFCRKREML